MDITHGNLPVHAPRATQPTRPYLRELSEYSPM